MADFDSAILIPTNEKKPNKKSNEKSIPQYRWIKQNMVETVSCNAELDWKTWSNAIRTI